MAQKYNPQKADNNIKLLFEIKASDTKDFKILNKNNLIIKVTDHPKLKEYKNLDQKRQGIKN